jgi:hypothetical protein
LFVYFETGSYYVAQAVLELTILLPQPPEYWDYRYVAPWLAWKNSYIPRQQNNNNNNDDYLIMIKLFDLFRHSVLQLPNSIWMY